jgi:hypothetical protein
MQGFPLIGSWLRPRRARLALAASASADSEDFHGKQELCRRIRSLSFRDRKRRCAAVFELMLADDSLAVMVRLEAARALARWGLVLPAAKRLLNDQGEIPALKAALARLIKDEEKVPA